MTNLPCALTVGGLEGRYVALGSSLYVQGDPWPDTTAAEPPGRSGALVEGAGRQKQSSIYHSFRMSTVGGVALSFAST